MARLRKGVCYRRLERPYTRVSKYRHLSFVKARPHVIITKFDMGNVNGKYDVQIDLISKDSLQVRQQPIEAVRRALVRAFDKKIGNSNYHLRIRKFPHHILRENPLATGAGADRLSTGMKHSFGKPIGVAAQVFEGDPLFTIRTKKQFVDVVRQALKTNRAKLPGRWSIIVKEVPQ